MILVNKELTHHGWENFWNYDPEIVEIRLEIAKFGYNFEIIENIDIEGAKNITRPSKYWKKYWIIEKSPKYWNYWKYCPVSSMLLQGGAFGFVGVTVLAYFCVGVSVLEEKSVGISVLDMRCGDGKMDF